MFFVVFIVSIIKVNYNYKGFTIWSADGEIWAADPAFINGIDKDDTANKRYDFTVENDCDNFNTIAATKKWINGYLKK